MPPRLLRGGIAGSRSANNNEYSPGDAKLNVIKVVREITGLGPKVEVK